MAARYDTIGRHYREGRRPDPRISARLWGAIGPAWRILNVGAGAGSYEEGPGPRQLVAVEPSAVMIGQRPPGAAPAVRADAEHLPFGADAFDVAMGVLTVHHWANLRQGLAEVRRVSRRQVLLALDPEVHDRMWLVREYLPAIAGLSDGAPLDHVVEALGAHTVEAVPIPADCCDGFLMAFWNRPERCLDPVAQSNTSAFALLGEAETAPGLARLAADLADGSWHRRHGDLLTRREHDVGLRLVIAGDTAPRARRF